MAFKYSETSELRPPIVILQTGLNCEVVLFLRLLNIENAVVVPALLGSGLYCEVVFIVRWSLL